MARRKHYNFYDDQFKATAVALTKIQGVKATDVAEALFIHPVMLYRWRMETRNGTLMASKKDINIDPKIRTELKRLRKLEREHNLLKQEHDLLKKSHPVLFGSKKEIFEFIDSHRGRYTLALMCRAYSVTPDGYYAWRRRGKSMRVLEDEDLYKIIFKIWKCSSEVYGSPKITEEMRSQGYRIGKKRVVRLMRENGLKARVATLYKATPGLEAFVTSIPNRQLKVIADKTDKVWVGDVTYLKVEDERRYLAVIMDKCSRKVIGWSLKSTRDSSLTLGALKQALRHRKPKAGLIFHSDRGIEYRAFKYSDRLAQRGIIQSMNRPRLMNDNAHMESFFHNLKAERIHGNEYRSDETLRGVITEYIGFYNNRRLHSSIGYLPPAEYESRIN